MSGTGPGACAIGIGAQPRFYGRFHWNTFEADALRQSVPAKDLKYYSSNWGRFGYVDSPSPLVIVPDWFLIGVAVALSAVPWLRWSKQFSIRTLLIAMTLIAVMLGAVVYLTKSPTTPPIDVGDFGREVD